MRKRYRDTPAAATAALNPPKRMAAHPAMITAALISLLLAALPLAKSEAVVNGPIPSAAPSWAVYLQGARGLCSGVLISDNLVLSAKHCTSLKLNSAAIGRKKSNDRSQGVERRIIAFEGYSGPDDIAVLELSRPVNQKPINISTVDIHLNPFPITLFGYGRNSDVNSPSSNDRNIHSVNGMGRPCDEEYKKYLDPSEICLGADNLNQGPCEGDSGAPIVDQAGELGAIYIGSRPHPGVNGPTCLATTWAATSVTYEPVRKWVKKMITRYELEDYF